MKAITLKQPWASLVATGLKQVENRTWAVPHSIRGERIAIHAGKGFDPEGFEAQLQNACCYNCNGYGLCDPCRWLEYLYEYQDESKLVAGKILCTARVVGQVLPNERWEIEWFTDEPCPECNGYGQVEYWVTGPEMISDVEDCCSCFATGHAKGAFDPIFQDERTYNWILADVQLDSDPTIYRGKLGLWELPDIAIKGAA